LKFKIERSALIHFSAQQMFDLVNDVEAYPSYMDGCVSARILRCGEDWMEAELVLGKAGIQQAFTTRNSLQAPEQILITLVDGPFKFMQGLWQFKPLAEDACKINFVLEFEMQNRLLGMAAGKLFESVAGKQVDVFCQRANEIYR
jgi:ribosome-associated toxin RatA of RatAB toxin-antitoxin module